MIQITSFIHFLVLTVHFGQVGISVTLLIKISLFPPHLYSPPPPPTFCLLIWKKTFSAIKKTHMLPHVARLKLSLLNAVSINFIENCFTSGLPSLCGILAPTAHFRCCSLERLFQGSCPGAGFCCHNGCRGT